MADDVRIAELERRVEHDPASIAFAQLAEEYRRAGRLDDAIRVSRAGLARYHSYPSARLTLGRALLALGLRDEATTELLAVANEAPEHIAAIRAKEELRALLPAGSDTAALYELERWLEAIRVDRARRIAGPPEGGHHAGPSNEGGHHADPSDEGGHQLPDVTP